MAVKSLSTRIAIIGRGAKCSGGSSAVDRSAYISRSSDFKPTIREAITDRENNILRLEFLRSKGWPAVDD